MRREFELTYYDVAVQHVNHYAMSTPLPQIGFEMTQGGQIMFLLFLLFLCAWSVNITSRHCNVGFDEIFDVKFISHLYTIHIPIDDILVSKIVAEYIIV